MDIDLTQLLFRAIRIVKAGKGKEMFKVRLQVCSSTSRAISPLRPKEAVLALVAATSRVWRSTTAVGTPRRASSHRTMSVETGLKSHLRVFSQPETLRNA